MTHTVRNDAIWRIAVVLVGVAALLTGCGGKPDAAACEQAMRKMLSTAVDAEQAGTTPSKGSRPPECNGLSDAELESLFKKVMGDEVNQRLGTTPSP